MAKQNSFDDYNTAPSATAAAFSDNDPAKTRVRKTNSMPNIFEQANPYPATPGANAPQTPDRAGPNITYIGGNPNSTVNRSQSKTDDLFAQARSTNDLADRSTLLRQALGSQQFDRAALGSEDTRYGVDTRTQNTSDIADLRAKTDIGINESRNTLDRDLNNQRSQDERYGVDTRASVSRDNSANSLLGRALEGQADRTTRERGQDLDATYRRDSLAADERNQRGYSIQDHYDALGTSFQNGSQQELDSLKAAHASARTPGEKAMIETLIRSAGSQAPGGFQGGMVHPGGFQTPGYAEGGIVEPGMPGAPPALPQDVGPDPALINKYTQYSEGAAAMGLTAIGFEQFAQMAQGAAATGGQQPAPSGAGAPVAMAEGGEVPSASEGGRMVIDSDPNAPTDSIPAVIDGNQPAKLDSGELVFPRHAVLYYGTDKLNKMIAKSKEAEGGNGESATGLNG